MSQAATLWAGRISGAQDATFWEFNRSLSFDRRLWPQDVQGSVAWAEALVKARVLSQAEGKRLTSALKKIHKDLERDASPLTTSPAEDVHSFVEQQLTALVGDLARKLHTGRSRNDQVATDLKLFVKEAVGGLRDGLRELMSAMVELAARYPTLSVPGYTHLQRAQPVCVAHHLLAYVEMLNRDSGRLEDALSRMDTCPLGSGALAGTAWPVDREALADALGFEGGPTRNSLDAVSDRDHVCEVVFACSLVLVHLSRFSEDWIFFASQEAGFLKLDDAVATGSSLMPQKKNPDALELLRGKTGRVLGHLQGLLVTIKGLPLAYNKDLQEDKEALFGAVDTTRACLAVAATVVRHASFDEAICARESERGFLNATDLADALVQAGVPFRTAHGRVGAAVREAVGLGVELQGLPTERLKVLLPELPPSAVKKLTARAVLDKRNVVGGTAPARVAKEIRAWKKRLDP